MKKIDSDALGDLNKAFGLTGAGSRITELADGVVDQAVSVNEIARRGRTQAGTTGIYYGQFQNVHGGATTLTTAVFPYNFGATGARPPYPNPMPPQFDIWLLGAAVSRVSGGGTLGAVLQLLNPLSALGWGLDDASAAVADPPIQVIAYWDTVVGVGTFIFATQQGGNGPQMQRAIRLPRHPLTQLRFVTSASVAATFNCYVTLGVFPVALGQDGLV